MTQVLCCTVSEAGAALAGRLPFEHRAGKLVATVRGEWARRDAFVIIGATGIAVRAIGPLLADKRSDPAVVCVDDTGRHAIALVGGHAGGANALARQVAAILGATPVVSTATDLFGVPALDDIPGWTAEGDVAGVTREWLDGRAPAVVVDEPLAGWPLPAGLATAGPAALATSGPPGARNGPTVVVTDRSLERRPGLVCLHPPSLVVGVGASSGADGDALRATVAEALAGAGLTPASVAAVATIDRKASEPAIVDLAAGLGVDLRSYAPEVLADAARSRGVPNPSPVVESAVGTPSVAEAAAVIAAGPGSFLAAAKRIGPSRDSTVAVARRARPSGHLAVVGLGPGGAAGRTLEAVAAVRQAGAVVGYGPYVDLAADLLRPGQDVVRYPIGAETERCRDALVRAARGQRVALVCSGDAGVYAMASLVCELAPGEGDPPLTVVAGVTAAQSAAARLGAPLGHDHASVSLSDLLTPWGVIAARLRAVAEADFVVSLYNPRSRRRTNQLVEAMAILSRHREPSTPAAILKSIGRPSEEIVRTTLGGLDPDAVDMLSLVVVGSSQTRWIGSRMVTPRGYATVLSK